MPWQILVMKGSPVRVRRRAWPETLGFSGRAPRRTLSGHRGLTRRADLGLLGHSFVAVEVGHDVGIGVERSAASRRRGAARMGACREHRPSRPAGRIPADASSPNRDPAPALPGRRVCRRQVGHWRAACGEVGGEGCEEAHGAGASGLGGLGTFVALGAVDEQGAVVDVVPRAARVLLAAGARRRRGRRAASRRAGDGRRAGGRACAPTRERQGGRRALA
jgi:hypothetical protein